MPLTLTGLKNCDTCKKAIKALEAAGHDVEYIDVRANGVSKKQLTDWAKTLGWEALLNTRSTTWRGLDGAEKEDMTQAKAIALISQHPTLMKRPVIEGNGELTLGWTKAVQEKYC